MAPQPESMKWYLLVIAVVSAALVVASLAMALSDPATHPGLFLAAAAATISLGLVLYRLRQYRREGRRPS